MSIEDRSDMCVDDERLWSTLETLSTVGGNADGGVCRIALTDEDATARALVLKWATEAGCEVRIDAIGNAFARKPGIDPGRAAVMIGSHLDTQPSGGRFDGVLGVLCGLEIIRTLHDHRIEHDAPVELAIWTDEEGSRFDVSCIGSSVYAGLTPLDVAYSLTDRYGISVRDELERLGWLGSAVPGQPRPDAYFEIHIEQGPVLEQMDAPAAVVTAVMGARWIEVEITGAAAHAGTTPYEARHDAVQAAARLTLAIDAIGRSRVPDARATVCTAAVEPNSGSVIAERVRLLIDLRHPQKEILDSMEDELAHHTHALQDDGFRVELRTTWSQPPVSFDQDCISLLKAAAFEHGVPAIEFLSGAAHDAAYVALVAPTAMLFVPSENGVSHNPAENTKREPVRIATNVLLSAVVSRVNRS